MGKYLENNNYSRMPVVLNKFQFYILRVIGVVRKLKEAIILSKIKEEPKTSDELAVSMKIEKSNITKSLSTMKKSGLVKGRGLYMITNKGKVHFNNTVRKISGRR